MKQFCSATTPSLFIDVGQ